MTNCPSCGTSVVVTGDVVRLAGEQGVMLDLPSLVALGGAVGIGADTWTAAGQARFSYGRGTWDEFWVLDGAGRGAWLSVDEGDVVLQQALDERDWPNLGPDSAPGAQATIRGRRHVVIEVEAATCEAVRGSLPEVLAVGEAHRFVNLSGDNAALVSGEFWDGGQAWYAGRWIDPFAIRRGGA